MGNAEFEKALNERFGEGFADLLKCEDCKVERITCPHCGESLCPNCGGK